MATAHHGRIVKTTGDRVLATFDGPGRAIQCACGLSERVKSLGTEIRTGLHASEVEVRDNDIIGAAVHLPSRIMEKTGANEVLVSRIVCDLVAGSEAFIFGGRREHTFKGIPGDWQVFEAEMNRYT